MSRLLVSLVIAFMGTTWFLDGCFTDPSHRTIQYKRDVPIADRLAPGDRDVLIHLNTIPGLFEVPPPESLDAEIQSLRTIDGIALVRVHSAQGELIEGESWIATRVACQVDQSVKGFPAENGRSITFSFSAGTIRIGEVTVSTEIPFPQFSEGQQYLVFVSMRPEISLSQAYHVNAQGLLEHVKLNTGGDQSFTSNLVGRDVSEVINLLSVDPMMSVTVRRPM